MSVFAQLWHTLVLGPLALFRLRSRSLGYLVLYLILCGALLYAVGYLLVTHRDDFLDALTAYLMPESWRFAARRLVEKMFASQVRQVLVNASVGGSLALLSALLFPLKEKVSAVFEDGAHLVREPPSPLPVWIRGLEELGLFLLFVTAQLSIFWIGYPPDETRKQLALWLSYFVLFSSFSANFISPLLQRRRMKYATIIKVLVMHPIVLLGFGALFTLPSVVMARIAHAHPEWPFARAVASLFIANVVCIVWGTVAGTWVASRLHPDAQRTRPPSLALRGVAWLAVLALFAANAYAFGAVGISLHRKSQLLKCQYTIDPSSLGVDLPALADVLQSEEVKLRVRLDLRIENPTPFDVELEKNRLEVKHQGTLIARAELTPVAVASGRTVSQHLELPIAIQRRVLLAKGRSLTDWHQWSITLYLEVAPNFDFPVYLLAPGGR